VEQEKIQEHLEEQVVEDQEEYQQEQQDHLTLEAEEAEEEAQVYLIQEVTEDLVLLLLEHLDQLLFQQAQEQTQLQHCQHQLEVVK
jgi:hypothetical protein